MCCSEYVGNGVMTRQSVKWDKEDGCEMDVVSRGAERSAASSYAAMCMVAGSRPDLVIA